MENKLIFILISSIVILITTISLMFLLFKKKKITNLINKISLAEKELGENLNIKLDIIIRLINIIERELKIESKAFDEIKKVNGAKVNNIILDNILADGTNEILEFKNDYKELYKTKSFDELIENLKNVDIYLNGGRKFYNKYAHIYNELLKTFPSNIIGRNLCNKAFYTENIMEENLKIDFTK